MSRRGGEIVRAMSWAVILGLLWAVYQPAGLAVQNEERRTRKPASETAKTKKKVKSGTATADGQGKNKDKNRDKKTKKAAKASANLQSAVVAVDGAAIYGDANFDSPVLEYVPRGRTLKVSKKIYPGLGGLGAFYRVTLKKGRYGYVTDVDVTIEGATPAAAVAGEGPGPADGLDVPGDEGMESAFWQRFVGLSVAYINWQEKVIRKDAKSDLLFYGVKLTGPNTILEAPVMDVELLFHLGAPDYYQSLSPPRSQPEGFLLLSHLIYQFLLYDLTNQAYFFGGLGVMVSFNNISLPIAFSAGSPPTDQRGVVESTEVALGGAMELGFAYQFLRSWAARLDARLYFENETYGGVGFAVQMRH